MVVVGGMHVLVVILISTCYLCINYVMTLVEAQPWVKGY